MALIFAASAQPQAAIPDFEAQDFLVKKTGHLLLYGTLALTYLRGLTYRSGLTRGALAAAVVLAGLYGATDEFHQSFVAGRGATLLDVGIDTLGAALGVLLAAWRREGRAGRKQTPAPF